jgi:hypothetical protein
MQQSQDFNDIAAHSVEGRVALVQDQLRRVRHYACSSEQRKFRRLIKLLQRVSQKTQWRRE